MASGLIQFAFVLASGIINIMPNEVGAGQLVYFAGASATPLRRYVVVIATYLGYHACWPLSRAGGQRAPYALVDPVLFIDHPPPSALLRLPKPVSRQDSPLLCSNTSQFPNSVLMCSIATASGDQNSVKINPQTMRHRVLPFLAPMFLSKLWRRRRRAKAIEMLHGVLNVLILPFSDFS
ncbi:hypothetical protein ACJJTC_016618 [Scirpophaga incertulas]